MEAQEEENIFLSKKNLKRFNKLTIQFNDKLKDLESKNSDLIGEINMLKGELESKSTSEFIEKKNLYLITTELTKNTLKPK